MQFMLKIMAVQVPHPYSESVHNKFNINSLGEVTGNCKGSKCKSYILESADLDKPLKKEMQFTSVHKTQ